MFSQKKVKNNFKLEMMLDITQCINEHPPLDVLTEKYRQILIDKLSIGKVAVFVLSKKWELLLECGLPHKRLKTDYVESIMAPYKEITRINEEFPNFLRVFDFLIPIKHHKASLAYILIGDIDSEMKGISPTIKHLGFIQTISNILIVAIENQRMHQKLILQETLKKDMEVAGHIQNHLIPNKERFPHNDNISAQGFYLPHQQIGGDYYDIIPFNENEIGFCIADVSGKGIPAALVMANFQATLRALFSPNIPLSELVHELNKKVCESTQNEKFITLFIGRYNCITRELDYVNAGHYPPILYNFTTKEVQLLKTGCIGLGMLGQIPSLKQEKLILRDHTKLLCYTDGIVELIHEDSVKLELNTLNNLFACDNNLKESFADLHYYISKHKSNGDIIDDISLLGLEFNRSQK